ncbi:hypothetical protein GCM10007079_05390 [Nocardiopsis terrae]|nr:hypothetical protein GCM10007079_05390 [Nocardiopsis terrae]
MTQISGTSATPTTVKDPYKIIGQRFRVSVIIVWVSRSVAVGRADASACR